MKLSRALLVKRCKKERLPSGGGKKELVERIINNLDKKDKKWTCTLCLYNTKNILIFGNNELNESQCILCGNENTKKILKNLNKIEYNDDNEKEWKSLIKKNLNKFINSSLIISKSYNLNNKFIDYYYDIKPKSKSFKSELIENNVFNEKEFNIILLKAKSIYSLKECKDKFKANFNGGININILKGDNIGIEHILSILIYIHFPKFVNNFRSSLVFHVYPMFFCFCIKNVYSPIISLFVKNLYK